MLFYQGRALYFWAFQIQMMNQNFTLLLGVLEIEAVVLLLRFFGDFELVFTEDLFVTEGFFALLVASLDFDLG